MRMCPSVFSGIFCCFKVVLKSCSTFPRSCERAKWVCRINSPKPRFCVNLRVNSTGKPYYITTPARVNRVHRDPLSIRGCSFIDKDIYIILYQANMWDADTPVWTLHAVAQVGCLFPLFRPHCSGMCAHKGTSSAFQGP